MICQSDMALIVLSAALASVFRRSLFLIPSGGSIHLTRWPYRSDRSDKSGSLAFSVFPRDRGPQSGRAFIVVSALLLKPQSSQK
jgi:hypothetical protein